MSLLKGVAAVRLNGCYEAIVFDHEASERVAACAHQHRSYLAALSCAERMKRQELQRRRRERSRAGAQS